MDLLLPEPPRGGAAPERPPLAIKKDAKGWVTVPGATVREPATYADLVSIMREGVSRRRTASTLMNADSSRSHQVFTVTVEATDAQTQAVSRGKLTFVDLAGSERVKKSGAAGETLREAAAINTSLAALGNVIK